MIFQPFMKRTLHALCLFACLTTTVYADRQCHAYSQAYYDTLLQQAQHNDKNAMFDLSGTLCDDCAKPLDGCAKDAVKWLKAAAENGHAEAKKLLQGKEPDGINRGLFLYRAQEIKNGSYVFSAYHDLIGYTAYFEISHQNHLVFTADNKSDVSEYRATLYAKNTPPILAIWLNQGGHAAQADMRYFSFGETLQCLVNKSTHSPHWQYNRFDEKPSAALTKALHNDQAEFEKCRE